MSALQSIIDIVLSHDILLYLGIICDGIVSIFLWKKSRLANSSTKSATDEDVQALIEYHETVAKKLKEKFKKE